MSPVYSLPSTFIPSASAKVLYNSEPSKDEVIYEQIGPKIEKDSVNTDGLTLSMMTNVAYMACRDGKQVCTDNFPYSVDTNSPIYSELNC